VGGVLYFVMQSRTREATDEVAEKAESAADEPYEQTEAGTDTTKYCIHCGKSIPEEARFCTKCGKSQSA
ncbi:MAG TPA: zinc ribbon domain-containing protein, partial [bacterium]|nr:zinc ribbon domain-containing protein [bacterium]